MLSVYSPAAISSPSASQEMSQSPSVAVSDRSPLAEERTMLANSSPIWLMPIAWNDRLHRLGAIFRFVRLIEVVWESEEGD